MLTTERGKEIVEQVVDVLKNRHCTAEHVGIAFGCMDGEWAWTITVARATKKHGRHGQQTIRQPFIASAASLDEALTDLMEQIDRFLDPEKHQRAAEANNLAQMALDMFAEGTITAEQRDALIARAKEKGL